MMTKNLRVKSGKAIDETYRISFKFNGSTYFGFKGDTLSSALLANGNELVGGRLKYDRPGRILPEGSEEQIPKAQTQNCLTSVQTFV